MTFKTRQHRGGHPLPRWCHQSGRIDPLAHSALSGCGSQGDSQSCMSASTRSKATQARSAALSARGGRRASAAGSLRPCTSQNSRNRGNHPGSSRGCLPSDSAATSNQQLSGRGRLGGSLSRWPRPGCFHAGLEHEQLNRSHWLAHRSPIHVENMRSPRSLYSDSGIFSGRSRGKPHRYQRRAVHGLEDARRQKGVDLLEDKETLGPPAASSWTGLIHRLSLRS